LEIRGEVEREYLAQRRRELKDAAYRKLREGYQVIVEPPKPQVDAAGRVAAAAASEPDGE
jgi:16S rRNA U516 pseudouridylate synthase RsuA-like enzyme